MERNCTRKKQKNGSCEKRSPLQNLNRLPFNKPSPKVTSLISSSSSAPSSAELPNFCSRNSSSSSSRSKPLSRPKENQIPQKSISNRPQCHREYAKMNSNSRGRRSKLSSVQGNSESKLKKRCNEFQAKTKNSRENCSGKRAFALIGVSDSCNLSSAEKCTPLGRLETGSGLDSANFVDNETVIGVNCDNGNAVKTPPVEASLSPEFQRQSHSKMLVLKSAVTPVCYGAGHLLSGVTDKRKCRRRGSLRGGTEKVSFSYDERVVDDVSDGMKESTIPSPAEASVRWHLSPNSDGIKLREGEICSESLGDNSEVSRSSLSSVNVIKTPDSGSSGDVGVGRSSLGVSHSKFCWSELDSVTETLERVSLSPDDPSQPRKNVDSVSSSWVSDATFGNLSLSQMRISWRDGLLSETEDADCCCLLSDDEITADKFAGKEVMLDTLSDAVDDKVTYKGSESCQRAYAGENDLTMGNDLSPVLLDYEPCISTRAKEKSMSLRADACAESICTDGGGLVASDDSDWTYFRGNHLC